MLKFRSTTRHWRAPGNSSLHSEVEQGADPVMDVSTWAMSRAPIGAHERLRLAAAELGSAGHLVQRTRVSREIRQLEAQLEEKAAALGWAVLPFMKRDGWRTDVHEVRDVLSDIETLRGLLADKRDQLLGLSPATMRTNCDG